MIYIFRIWSKTRSYIEPLSLFQYFEMVVLEEKLALSNNFFPDLYILSMLYPSLSFKEK